MKTIYKDDECSLSIERMNPNTVKVHFSNIYGEKTFRLFNTGADWETAVDEELRWWGVRESVVVLEAIEDFIEE
jgi:hypothetical protein